MLVLVPYRHVDAIPAEDATPRSHNCWVMCLELISGPVALAREYAGFGKSPGSNQKWA
jgi:hypothetical protein